MNMDIKVVYFKNWAFTPTKEEKKMYLLNFVILFFLLILISTLLNIQGSLNGYQTYYLDVLLIADGTSLLLDLLSFEGFCLI